MQHATSADVEALAELEKLCFPPQEAASEDQLRERVARYGNHFYLLYEGERLVSFVDGPVVEETDLKDEMFSDPTFHTEDGAWQMIFGVNTHPDYRRRGLASRLIREMVRESREQGRKGIVLTCKVEKIPFYARLGFHDEGVSGSEHGGALWHQMRLQFEPSSPESEGTMPCRTK